MSAHDLFTHPLFWLWIAACCVALIGVAIIAVIRVVAFGSNVARAMQGGRR